MIPRVCRRFKEEYIAQDDKVRTGKPLSAYDDQELREIGRLRDQQYQRLPHGFHGEEGKP